MAQPAVGGVEKHLECRSTVSRGHFSTGTHGHLHLSHFLHDLDTFMRVRGRAAADAEAAVFEVWQWHVQDGKLLICVGG